MQTLQFIISRQSQTQVIHYCHVLYILCQLKINGTVLHQFSNYTVMDFYVISQLMNNKIETHTRIDMHLFLF